MRRLLYLLPVLCCGCAWPKWLLPAGNMIGKNSPHFGTVNNYYQSDVVNKTTPWELYFWIAVIVASVVFTPLGGILVSKWRKWKATAVHTIKGVEKYKSKLDPEKKAKLGEILAKRQTPRIHSTVKEVTR